MRLLLALVAIVALAIPLSACAGIQGTSPDVPMLTLRSPVMLDAEPRSVAGPRLHEAPARYAPSYQQISAPQMPPMLYAPAAPAAPSACAPSYSYPPPGYSYEAPPAAAPCR